MSITSEHVGRDGSAGDPGEGTVAQEVHHA